MTDVYRNTMTYQILQGNALDVLRSMDSESVQTCITSPPYYGLRSYQTVPQVWDGDEFCGHVWGSELKNPKLDTRPKELKIAQGGSVGSNVQSEHWSQGTMGSRCRECNAWRGELGLEPTFQLYISHLLQIFAEVKRVVKKDGCVFVNLGDSYAGSGKGIGDKNGHGKSVFTDDHISKTNWSKIDIRAKSLMNIPHRFFIGMTDELQMIQRNNINWWKRACMPSSATDRWTVDFESIGFFTKNAKYKFNQQLELAISQNEIKILGRGKQGFAVASAGAFGQPQQDHSGGLGYSGNGEEKERNARTTWDVGFEPSGDEHYASYPTKLVEKMLLASTDEGDTVLDIFNGTATTGLVALRNKRHYIGIELQPKYIAISERRLQEVQVKLFI